MLFVELTDEEMLAQAILFFFGGFNTISDTLSFLFHHLAEHPEVQEKLYREIEETLQENDGVMNYEILMKMPYLEMVINGKKYKYKLARDRYQYYCNFFIILIEIYTFRDVY